MGVLLIPCSHGDFTAIVDLPAGRHEYKFFVDGQWLHDPNEVYHSIPQYTTVYHSISQYTTVYYSIPQYTTVYHSISQYITVTQCGITPLSHSNSPPSPPSPPSSSLCLLFTPGSCRQWSGEL